MEGKNDPTSDNPQLLPLPIYPSTAPIIPLMDHIVDNLVGRSLLIGVEWITLILNPKP